MKYTIKRKIEINSTLDSSECIMFTKGGKHNITLSEKFLRSVIGEKFSSEDDDEYLPKIETEIVFTIQMDQSDQSRFNFIKTEADKHKERVKDENRTT